MSEARCDSCYCISRYERVLVPALVGWYIYGVLNTQIESQKTILTKQIESQKALLESQKTLSEYIKIIGDSQYPPYAKSLALGSLLRSNLVNPDFLFTAGYRLQDETKGFIMKDFLWEYAKHDPISSPIGFVDRLIYDKKSNELTVSGWAIDKKTPSECINIYIGLGDDKLDNDIYPLSEKDIKRTQWERKDIKAIFSKYENLSLKSGFELIFKIPAEKIGKQTRLRITLQNKDYYWMDIINKELDLKKSFNKVISIEK